ncbi:DUF222 domain-containing protein [Cryptosporangium sp. NPDC048952]|uniref:HNH endonuclease signature motif containing protein n=1 Tax=Cryptosporangium sp. NPDC048952 TaxID=3363961 RepID=UPI0037187C2F
MSSIAAAMRELAAEDLGGFSDEAQLERVREWEQLLRLAEAGQAAALAAVHSRGAGAYDGSRSTSAWMQGGMRLSPREAASRVTTAVVLPQIPRFQEALNTAEITREHAAVGVWLARAVEKVEPALVARAEALLFPHALRLHAADLRKIAQRIKDHLVPPKDDPPEPEFAVYLAQTYGKVWDLRGGLSPEFGGMIETYLRSLPPRSPGDTGTAAEWRHDELMALFKKALESLDPPTSGGERPHLMVLVQAADLRHLPDGRTVFADDPFAEPTHPVPPASAEGGGPFNPDPGWDPAHGWDFEVDWDWNLVTAWLTAPEPASAATSDSATGVTVFGGSGSDPVSGGLSASSERLRFGRIPAPGDGAVTEYGDYLPSAALHRLACDAMITRVVLGPGDVPLAMGRRARLVTTTQHRALVVRDKGCRFPHCTRPPQWTEAHHVVPWTQGGPTDLGNLLSLCSFHHHRVHDDGWRVEFDGNEATFFRPDGTVLPAPPR